MAQICCQKMLHLPTGGSFEAQPQIGRIAVGAPDAELLHFETAAGFDHFVEDLLHHMRVDQVAFGFNCFFKRHEPSVYRAPCSTEGAMLKLPPRI